MDLYAFIAILVPKLVAMVTPLCPLCIGVSQMNSPIAQTLSQNQTLHGYVAYNWSYDHFCDILAKIWLPWQRHLDPCNQKCLLWVGRPLKPYPRIKNFVNSCYTSEVMWIRRFATRLALREWGIFGIFAINMESYLKVSLTPKGTYLA